MNINGIAYRAVFWNNGAVHWVEQRLLPHRFDIVSSGNPEDVALAIETMQIRGAPSIGAAAAFGLALAYSVDEKLFFSKWLERFRRTRPTAVNLFHACDYMEAIAKQNLAAEAMVEAACDYADEEVKRNKNMGLHLAERLAVGQRRIQTHCNAGWLAAVDWGTALSGIYQLAEAGESPSVWVDETRPRLQGARLTAWELSQQGIACKLQADSAAAWMMAQGKVDAVVTGADRIAANGDVANKVGTYMLALAAKTHGIPFYVAAPESTFDQHCATGADIPIEERGEEEVLELSGEDTSSGSIQHIRLTAPNIKANNPAFDVTPNCYITAIIHEHGVWSVGSNHIKPSLTQVLSN